LSQSVTVYDINHLDKAPEVINLVKLSGLPESKAVKRVVHAEYNASGDEVWFSLWAGKTEQSAIVIMDDKTRKVKAVISDPRLITPTGKFNIWNTQEDIY